MEKKEGRKEGEKKSVDRNGTERRVSTLVWTKDAAVAEIWKCKEEEEEWDSSFYWLVWAE